MTLRSCSVVNGELENFRKKREKRFDFCVVDWLFDEKSQISYSEYLLDLVKMKFY